MVKLTVGEVNLQNKTITLSKTKNKKTRTISIPKEALEELKEFIGDKPAEKPLFGVKIRAMEAILSEMIKRLRVKPNGRGSHAFRHSTIMSMLRDAHLDVGVVAEIAGNTARTIYTNYSTCVRIDEQMKAEKAFDRIRKPKYITR